MEQGNWVSAFHLINKSLIKDTANVEAELLLTRWYLLDKNPAHQIDSAYQHALFALWDFQMATPKQREKLQRNQVDSTSIVLLRIQIDSMAFEQAKQINTEKSYLDFLARHDLAKEKLIAIELRDEVAFLSALRENSYLSFANYLDRYPQSHRAKEAKARYDKLLFEAKTKDNKLASYVAFAKEFPDSPLKAKADKNIFELTTCAGEPSAFKGFIEQYPKNYFVDRAIDILFHVLKETDELLPSSLLTDSLKGVVQLNKLLWAPIYKNQRYGFIDSDGKETLAPEWEGVSQDYRCGLIKDDVLQTSRGLISRNGKVLTASSTGKDIGYGFYKTGDSTCFRVIHKSGWTVINECLQDVWVLGGRYLVVKKDQLLGLYALNGRMLLPVKWSSIEEMEGVLVLSQFGKKILCTPGQLALAADGNPLAEDKVYDNVRVIEPGLLQVSNGRLEGILNSNLEFVVPFERQSLIKLRFGLVRRINEQYIFTGLSPEMETTRWESFKVYGQWLLLKRNPGIQKLFDTHSKKWAEADPDSVWFDKGLAFARLGDSLYVHINSSSSLSLEITEQVNFIDASDSIHYFFVNQKKKKVVFSIESGEKLFTTDVDRIDSLTPDFFLVTRKNKKGILSKSGKLILPIEYDAVVLTNDFQLSLLKEKKFGLYDLPSGRLIKPLFERNISVLDKETLIAFKNGYYGLIDWTASVISLFEFDAILPWSDDEIWVKKGFEWRLFDYKRSQTKLIHIKSFDVFKHGPMEKLALVRQENFFGVLSSKRGMIIPTTFTYITNLSSEEEPLYFTAKEIEEAGIVVVIYYNKDGKFIRKQVYEEDEYARIVCSDD